MNIPFTTNHRLFQLPTQLQCNRLFRRHFVTTPNPYRSESELHRRTKEYIAEKLNEVDKLDVEIFCDLPGRWFRCRNSRIIKGWAKRWERVETEYHIANVGRLDVAVLYPQRKTRTRSKPLTDMLYWMRDDSKPFDVQARSFLDRFLKGKERVFTFPSSLNATERKTVHEICDQLSLQHYSSGNSLRTLKVIKPDDIISPIEPSGDLTGFAAIEVLVSSAMTQSKVDLLNDSQIPWIEVKAEESMYSGRHPWNPKTPLPVHRTNQSYHCTECAEKFQNSLRIKQMMLVDIYPGGTKSGFAFVQRRLFTILEKKNLGIPNSENLGIPSSEESRKFEQEYFLTESGINVTNYIHIKAQIS
eukprot:TRINITY_DN7772_c0_g1_i2.p1 TRINITY_DN7772_c0_g1~~TRINITY_DN7772_c0_g1_i2.p1  ORF type:complete len:358 (+),score=84.09 TRINITY_DN7772_c0_g1_i2:88-1161(+)